jgi:uncharacterized protein
MRQKISLALALFLSFLFYACSGAQTTETSAPATHAPSANTSNAQATPSATPQEPQIVTAAVEETNITAGGAGEAAIRLDIAEGYHVNANPASDKFFIATELKAEPQEGITPGKPAYPSGRPLKFEFWKTPISVYEGKAAIRLPLRADKTATKGLHVFHTTIRVQPCNAQGCLQPRTIEANVPLTIN